MVVPSKALLFFSFLTEAFLHSHAVAGRHYIDEDVAAHSSSAAAPAPYHQHHDQGAGNNQRENEHQCTGFLGGLRSRPATLADSVPPELIERVWPFVPMMNPAVSKRFATLSWRRCSELCHRENQGNNF